MPPQSIKMLLPSPAAFPGEPQTPADGRHRLGPPAIARPACPAAPPPEVLPGSPAWCTAGSSASPPRDPTRPPVAAEALLASARNRPAKTARPSVARTPDAEPGTPLLSRIAERLPNGACLRWQA